MTVAELLDKILAAYPGATVDAIATFKPVFYARFQHREGDRLAAAAAEVFANFRATGRQPFPIPADFEQHMPSTRINIPGDSAGLDFKAHGERVRALMADWRRGQGHRGANGVIEVLRALEFIAEPLANLKAWEENPSPIVLTTKQLRLAQQRAISMQRRIAYGAMPRTNEVWWEQIQAVAAQWGVPVKYEDWGTIKKEAA